MDLIYLDPPFNTGRRRQQGEATFPDRWRWDDSAEESFRALGGSGPEPLARTIKALVQVLGRGDMAAYLVMLAPRLQELHRVLKPTGSLYLHCDPRTSPYLRLLLEAIFGRAGFRNEIVWHYTGGGRSQRYFSRKHDHLLFYVKSARYTFNLDPIREPYRQTSGYAKGGITSAAGKHYQPHPRGTPPDDVWDLPIINPLSQERLGYPSQKPLALLERIIKASTNEGDLVLDPFCGSGTTLVAAQHLGRHWLGMDNSSAAISLSEARLAAEFGSPSYRLVKLS